MIAIVTRDEATADLVIAEAESRGQNCQRYSEAHTALEAMPALMFLHWPRGEPVDKVLSVLTSSRNANVPVVVLAPPGSSQFLHRMRTNGAVDTLLYPPDPTDVGAEIEDYCRADRPTDRFEMERFRKVALELLIGQNAVFRRRCDEARVAARSDVNVLLLGETGTGKEMFARAIHKLSRRFNHPFQAVNCAAFTDTLLETELFGIGKDVATGTTAHIGHFQAAGAGTLLLDEIGLMKLESQPKLLRVIDQREFQRVGETTTTKFTARLICATSRDLDEAVQDGKFGPDLLGRIRQFPIVLPPLRDRKDDIRPLTLHFVEKHARARHVEIGAAAMDILEGYDFPFNIRELENIVTEALARSDPGHTILPKHLPDSVICPRETEKGRVLKIRVPRNAGYKEIRAAAELEVDRQYLAPVLERTGDNVSQAATELGIDRKTVNTRWEQLKQTGPSE